MPPWGQEDGESLYQEKIKTEVDSCSSKFCMRDTSFRLGADWLPSVMGLVESSRAEAVPEVSSL